MKEGAVIRLELTRVPINEDSAYQGTLRRTTKQLRVIRVNDTNDLAILQETSGRKLLFDVSWPIRTSATINRENIRYTIEFIEEVQL